MKDVWLRAYNDASLAGNVALTSQLWFVVFLAEKGDVIRCGGRHIEQIR